MTSRANANVIAEPTLGYIDPEITTVERAESGVLANQKSTKGKWQRFVSWIWDPDYYEKSDHERSLVQKMDLGILIPIVFGYIMKSIDQNNLSNAYVSGMREDLAMTRNEYTYCLVIYSAVYCVLQVPGNLLVLKFRPSIILCICECSWGAFTFAQAGAQNVQQIYVFRFFVAFFEAPFQPAVILLLGSWYTPRELAKRVSIWFIAARTGAAFSGFMQAAIYRTMDGLAGLPGWRWLYIICGIMTMPCGIALYFFLPDFPDTTKVWYLTPEDRALAKERCALQGTKPHTGIVDRQTFKRIMKRWHVYVFLPTYFFYAWSVQSYTVFGPYLLQLNYPISMRNIYPALSELIGLPCVLAWGYLSDRFQSRFAFTFGPLATLGLFGTGVLCFYANSKPLRLTSFMISHTYFVTNIFYTWVNECCKDDAAERAFVIAASNSFFYAFNAWLPTILFLQTDGPRWAKGFPSLFGSVFGACTMFVVVWVFHNRQLREEAAARDNDRGGVEAVILPESDTKEEIK